MKKSISTKLLTEIAIFAAVGFILDSLQGYICDFLPFWPNGGSVGIAMCAVFIVAFRHGAIGLLLGFIIGVLDLMDGVWVSPFADSWYLLFCQIFLDYFGAWMLVGLSGLFAKFIKNNTNKKQLLWVVIAVIVGSLGKFLCHFASGMLFWPNDDAVSKFIYAFTYNLSYMGPSCIICCILMVILVIKQPKLLLTTEV